MQLRTSASAEDFVQELTTENGGIVLGGTDGTIELYISATDMAALTPATYRYDLEMVNGSYVRKILKGKFKVLAEVTK